MSIYKKCYDYKKSYNYKKFYHRKSYNKSPLALAIGLALSAQAQATIITVDGNAVDNMVNGNCSLIEAINSANTDSAIDACRAGRRADTIKLSNTTFTLTAVNNYATDNNGLPAISSDITIAGNGATIMRDSGAPDFRILYISEEGTLNLQDTTISGGSLAGDTFAAAGGGIFNDYGDLNLANSTVSDNSAGIGGGIFSYGGTNTLTNSTVSGNTTDAQGGGIATFGSTTTLTDSTVSGNSSGYGGGIWAYGAFTTLNNTTVSGNSAVGYSGEGYGGGIYGRAGEITLNNSTISGNNAGDSGGGILNYNSTVTLSSSTVSGNSASAGGGVYSVNFFEGSSISLTNTILSNNGDECGFTGSEPVLVSDGGFNWIEDATCGIPAGTGSINLGLLADNGGPTQTHALLAGSAAIDQIPELDCGVATDQRGIVRPQGAGCDIGAFELELEPASSSTLCSALGNNASAYLRDIDKFRFEGTAGETVTLSLDTDPGGTNNGGDRSILTLVDEIYGIVLFHKDVGPFVNEINVTLPSDGSYKIIVTERPAFYGDTFTGDYCINLDSDMTPVPGIESISPWVE